MPGRRIKIDIPKKGVKSISYYISKKPSNASKRVKLVIILAVLLVAAVVAGLAISLPRLPVAGKSDTLVFSEIIRVLGIIKEGDLKLEL